MTTPISLLELVAAVRADTLLGKNTCSVVDECYTDDELVDLFAEHNINTFQGAKGMARDIEIRRESRNRGKCERYADLLTGGQKGNILVTDYQGGLVRVDRETGVQTVIASGGLLRYPVGLAIPSR